MGEALITRRGGGKVCKTEVTFATSTKPNANTVVTIDVGFKPVFLYMELKDATGIDSGAAKQFSISFTPEWEMVGSSYCGFWWWEAIQSNMRSDSINHNTGKIIPTETGITTAFDASYTETPRFHGTYTVWAYG